MRTKKIPEPQSEDGGLVNTLILDVDVGLALAYSRTFHCKL